MQRRTKFAREGVRIFPSGRRGQGGGRERRLLAHSTPSRYFKNGKHMSISMRHESHQEVFCGK